MFDPTIIRLSQIITNERLEAAAQARQVAGPAGTSLIERLRGTIGASISQPVLPVRAASHKLNS